MPADLSYRRGSIKRNQVRRNVDLERKRRILDLGSLASSSKKEKGNSLIERPAKPWTQATGDSAKILPSNEKRLQKAGKNLVGEGAFSQDKIDASEEKPLIERAPGCDSKKNNNGEDERPQGKKTRSKDRSQKASERWPGQKGKAASQKRGF